MALIKSLCLKNIQHCNVLIFKHDQFDKLYNFLHDSHLYFLRNNMLNDLFVIFLHSHVRKFKKTRQFFLCILNYSSIVRFENNAIIYKDCHF